MIFIPDKKDCAVWKQLQDGINIIYFVDGNNTKEFPIQFFWSKPKHAKYYESFNLQVKKCMNQMVLCCSCYCYPQLRYNKIINKWFCVCASSAVGTHDNDQSEIDTLINKNKMNYDNGFCDNPIEAILIYNKISSQYHINAINESLQYYNNQKNVGRI